MEKVKAAKRTDWPEIRILGAVILLAGAVLVSQIGGMVGCAHVGSARHVSTVSLVVIHQTLATIQDSEQRLVCGRTSAPEPPQCVPIETHRNISGYLVRAFALESQAAAITRDLPDGDKGMAVVSLLGDIGGLVREILTMIPQSPQRDAIVSVVNGSPVRVPAPTPEPGAGTKLPGGGK